MYEPGDVLGAYRVVQVIGEGGSAVVCEVVEESTGETLALKVLGLRTTQLTERLKREAKILKRLVHPNILEIYGLIEVDERPAIPMEFVDGESLGEWMKSHPERDLETSMRIFQQIVAAVRFAHTNDVIHRDLKPANVLLSQSNEVKIADFGIAKRPDQENTLELTRPEMALGTPSYTAPEQVRDARSVDHRADVFSMGCILFELVCGQRAFGNRNMMERLIDMSEGNYPDPDTVVRGLDASLVQAIHGALVAEPDARIPDCDTLLAVLGGEVDFPVEGKSGRQPMSDEETQEAVEIPVANAPVVEADPTVVEEIRQPRAEWRIAGALAVGFTLLVVLGGGAILLTGLAIAISRAL